MLLVKGLGSQDVSGVEEDGRVAVDFLCALQWVVGFLHGFQQLIELRIKVRLPESSARYLDLVRTGYHQLLWAPIARGQLASVCCQIYVQGQQLIFIQQQGLAKTMQVGTTSVVLLNKPRSSTSGQISEQVPKGLVESLRRSR